MYHGVLTIFFNCLCILWNSPI